ncbi:hypothetical protein SVIOM74S_07609 [Streptomyces violarus]
MVVPGGRAAARLSRSSPSYGSLTMPSGFSTRLSPTRSSSAAAASMASYDVPDMRPITRIRSPASVQPAFSSASSAVSATATPTRRPDSVSSAGTLTAHVTAA